LKPNVFVTPIVQIKKVIDEPLPLPFSLLPENLRVTKMTLRTNTAQSSPRKKEILTKTYWPI
jgi:hypothetical protein